MMYCRIGKNCSYIFICIYVYVYIFVCTRLVNSHLDAFKDMHTHTQKHVYAYILQLIIEYMILKCMDPLICGFFSIDAVN